MVIKNMEFATLCFEASGGENSWPLLISISNYVQAHLCDFRDSKTFEKF